MYKQYYISIFDYYSKYNVCQVIPLTSEHYNDKSITIYNFEEILNNDNMFKNVHVIIPTPWWIEKDDIFSYIINDWIVLNFNQFKIELP